MQFDVANFFKLKLLNNPLILKIERKKIARYIINTEILCKMI